MRSIWPALLLLCCTGAAAQSITNSLRIVAPDGESTVAYDANAAGQVAAVLEDELGRQHGVLFEKGRLTELSLQGGYSDAKAINQDGVVVGSAQTPGRQWRAYLYDKAHGMRQLGTLGGASSFGMALNRAGQAVGFADTAQGDYHAFKYIKGEPMQDLGTLGGKISYASGINNLGQVVGTSAMHDGYRHAFLYDDTRGMIDLGTLGGLSSSAAAINDAGVIVGASQTRDGRWHAFIHQDGKMTDLGAVIGPGASFATDINNAGHVVGTVLRGDERQSFVWRDGRLTVHRGGKGLHLTHSINDSEVVVGATFDRKLDAATMPSKARALVVSGGYELLTLIFSVVLTAAAAVGIVFYIRREKPLPRPA
ncbi:HAF repeat-containing protein [Massilia sp. PAMC28688]|uniref:HAF repeat-containing protein n=1 Tax=Massilia sp. PAMC28688 TaxID=2861283 RepID=UPI001C635EB1|nr:HAF repeat-containing protein [Massilia sp. PAMC28688]QYF92324.1 HAF repeat-containing protein [Massilia sp. PAMC28688]